MRGPKKLRRPLETLDQAPERSAFDVCVRARARLVAALSGELGKGFFSVLLFFLVVAQGCGFLSTVGIPLLQSFPCASLDDESAGSHRNL